MKDETFQMFKLVLINKTIDKITKVEEHKITANGTRQLTSAQIAELIHEQILPRLDTDDAEGRDLWTNIYDMDLVPTICFSCLIVQPDSDQDTQLSVVGIQPVADQTQVNYCGFCNKSLCTKCMPMIETRYADEEFTEMICIKCLSDVCSKPKSRTLSDEGWFLNLSHLYKHYHIIPRAPKMEPTVQRQIVQGAIEMQARPSGSLFITARDEFNACNIINQATFTSKVGQN